MLVQPTYNARHSAPVESGRIGVFLEDYCIPHAPRRRRMSLKSMEFPPIPSVSHIPYVPLTLFGPIWRFSGILENSQEFHEFSGLEPPTTVLALWLEPPDQKIHEKLVNSQEFLKISKSGQKV